MEQKEFLQVTTKVMEEYGFKKIKKSYYLELKNIILKIVPRKHRFDNKRYCFGVTFIIKAFKDTQGSLCWGEGGDHVIVMNALCSVPDIESVDKNVALDTFAFIFENFSEYKWVEVLNEMLHRYFDAFKVDDFQAIRDANSVRNNNFFFVLSKEIADYIGVNER